MTRRIALSILLSACAMLVVGGIAAYVSVRETLLAELDRSLIERASALLRTAGVGDQSALAPVPEGDRYMIRSPRGYTIARPEPQSPPSERPTVVSRGFASAAEGARMRTMTLRWDDPVSSEPLTIIYSTPAARFDKTMGRLAVTLTVVLAIGVAFTSAVAVRVARIATRPLQETAHIIGRIDDRHLDRRIETAALPRELVPVATRLNEMLERLERALAERRQFMIDAAHELRSPVAALRTTMEVALQPPIESGSFTAVLNKCLKSTRMLNRLVDQLTEQIRGDGHNGRRDPESVDVAGLLHECADLLAPLAQTTHIRLARAIPRTLPVVTDPQRLRSIVVNLLSNAVEYTEAGGEVRIECSRREDQIQIMVSDTGVGIAPEHLPHIFEPFYRADVARGQESDHLGLGLYIVRSHVQALGGSCDVTSKPGKGTTMTITLPAREPDAAATRTIPKSAPEGAAISC